MTSEKSIFEVRRHTLMSAILIGVTLSIIYIIYLRVGNLSPSESILTHSALGDNLYVWQLRYPIMSQIITLLGVVGISLKLGQVASRFDLYGTPTYLPLELYPLLSVGIMVNVNSIRLILTSTLILYSLLRFFSAYKSTNRSGKLTSGALALGVVVLIYPPSITLWLVVPYMLVIFDRTLKEVIVTFIALVTPLFAYSYINWLCGGGILDGWNNLCDILFAHSGFAIFNSFGESKVAILTLVLYLSISSIFSISILDNTARAKQRLKLIAAYVVLISSMMVLPSSDSSVFGLLAIPLALITPITILKVGRVVSFVIYIALYLLAAIAMLWI